ncbi:MAG: hypothetical protein LBP59_17120 [Planctomycetaceae bacterium]|jgi:DNA-binding transcriptional regulator LsrR (DeoR family)|nr:hypothetical protein [Planctomycetaceae bacterium]
MAKKLSKHTRWSAAQETDEFIFAVCDRYFYQLGLRDSGGDNNRHHHGAATSVANWVRRVKKRTDITRERIYPIFWEACNRGFLLLQPPTENKLTQKLRETFQLGDYRGEIIVVNVNKESAARHVTSTAADLIVKLIEDVGAEKAKKFPDDPEKQAVHLGMGAGYAAMLVAQRLASKIKSGDSVPQLVLHAISTGGFLPNEPHKAPSTYFTYFEPDWTNIKFVALFSETVVGQEDYEKMKLNPGIKTSFDKRDEIDIIVTSLAAADHEHGLLVRYLTYLVDEGLIDKGVLDKMFAEGWVGDVQFRPYSVNAPLPNEVCPVRAVTLFELDELVKMAKEDNGKHVVLVAGPCGECGKTKKHALLPLIANENLRLWTHLVTDVRTARELLCMNK